jgi:hypothetical protein
MSAQPSPDGSPVGASTEGQGATAGEVLAMRMIQAAESAATAAQAATQAVAALTANAVGSQSTIRSLWLKPLAQGSNPVGLANLILTRGCKHPSCVLCFELISRDPV